MERHVGGLEARNGLAEQVHRLDGVGGLAVVEGDGRADDHGQRVGPGHALARDAGRGALGFLEQDRGDLRARGEGDGGAGAEVVHPDAHRLHAEELRALQLRPALLDELIGGLGVALIKKDVRAGEQLAVARELHAAELRGPAARARLHLAQGGGDVVAHQPVHVAVGAAQVHRQVAIAALVGPAQARGQAARELAQGAEVAERPEGEGLRGAALPGDARAAVAEDGVGAVEALEGGGEAALHVGGDAGGELEQAEGVGVVDAAGDLAGRIEQLGGAGDRGAAGAGDEEGLHGERARHAVGLAELEREEQEVARLQLEADDGQDVADAERRGPADVHVGELGARDRAGLAPPGT